VALDREKSLQAAQKLIEKKRFDRALEEYQRLVQDDPNDARTLLKLGDLQVRMQQSAAAMQSYDRVAKLYEAQGFAVKALAVYKQIREHIQKRAPELADQFAHITPRLARIYTQLGLKSDAIQAFDEVALRLMRAGKKREAIDAFREMVELDRSNPLSHVRLGEAFCQIEDYASARQAFSEAVEVLQRLGRDDDALKVIDRALHFENDPVLARTAAEILLRRGNRADGLQALTKLQICFQADPKDLTVLGMLAQAFSLIEQPEKAVEVYKQMALIAREKGDQLLFVQLVDYLVQVAPQDDQVRAMRLLLQQPQTPPPPAAGTAVDESVFELPDDDVVDEIDNQRSASAENADPVEVEYEDVDNADFDSAGYSDHALHDADAYLRNNEPARAVEPLRFALELEPTKLELHYKLREVLAQVGDYAAMRAESLQIAALLVDSGYLPEAAPFLSEVLAEEPRNDVAIQLYTSVFGHPPVAQPSQPSPSASEPLPSFEVTESIHPSSNARSGSLHLDDVDDPFADVGPSSSQTSLPSFALDDDDDDVNAVLSGTQVDEVPPADAKAADVVFGLEEVLDEAEFFAARGLFDDARGILEDQLVRTPNHPLLLEKLREVLQASAGISPSEDGDDRSHVVPSQYPAEDDDEFSATLNALDTLEVPSAQFRASKSAIDVDQVFAKFKEGVRAQVDESDSATHYDLGVAYKEMGLINDAIKELEIAARDTSRECMCYAMIGLIHLEQNEVEEAEQSYLRGLDAPKKTIDQEMSLYYDLGIVNEMKTAYPEAVYYFKKIARKDPGFRDVKERLLALEQAKQGELASSQRPIGEEDEFERVFDDLFDSK
jgi:tetratricopeptide (TPR) repeat protein